jgi:hypothetical protein
MPFCCLRTLIGETDPMSGNQEGTWLKDQQLNQLAWTLPNSTHGALLLQTFRQRTGNKE